jgi:hypothetical protein
MLHFVFFVEAVQTDAAMKRCASTNLFYAISFQSVNSKACGSKVAAPIFLFCFDCYMLKMVYEIKQRVRTSCRSRHDQRLCVSAHVAALTCTKNINDKFSSEALMNNRTDISSITFYHLRYSLSFIFFARCFSLTL